MPIGKSLFTEAIKESPSKDSPTPHFYIRYEDLLIEDMANFFMLIEEIRLEFIELNEWTTSEFNIGIVNAHTGQSIAVDIIAAFAQGAKKIAVPAVITGLFLAAIELGFSEYRATQKHHKEMEMQDVKIQDAQIDVEIKRLQLEKQRRDLDKSNRKEKSKKQKTKRNQKTLRSPQVDQSIIVNVNASDSATIRFADFIMNNGRISRFEINGRPLKSE